MRRTFPILVLVACVAEGPEGSADPTEVPVDDLVERRTEAPSPSSSDVSTTDRDASLPRLALAPLGDGDDASLFEEATHLAEEGRPDEMRERILELIRDHPSSPFVPHAYLLLGDVSFETDRPDAAARFFSRAAVFDDLRVVAYAHYRSP